jgi:multicomponent Na+:H+ antiporter subunit D
VVATFRYLLIGTIAATLYLLGIGYLYAVTGTLNMADMASLLPGVVESRAVYVAAALILVGLAIKTALFPMHGWLPDVYSYGPAPATAFVSSAMGKVSAYALIRIVYFIFDAQGPAGEALTLLGWVSAVAVMAGSIMAIAQQDIRRMLAYSSVGQMGYIALGLSLGNALALTGALLHMLNHAVMKGCLFLVAGGARWRAGAVRVADFAGMARLMPVSMAGFSIAALSMIGLPPAAGFFSKWYLLSGAVEARAWPFVVAVVASSLLSLVYFFRIIELAYLREPAPAGAGSRAIDEKAPELPWTMLGPIVVLAGSVLLLGVFNQTVVSRFVSTALPLWMR